MSSIWTWQSATTASGAKVQEVERGKSGKSESARWDFEGDWKALVAECEKDSLETGCKSYVVEYNDWSDGGEWWSVWRLQ